MANCSECKWRKGGLPKNYICFYQEGVSQFKHCSWFEKDETEQKGASMGICKECNWWKCVEQDKFGWCQNVSVWQKLNYCPRIAIEKLDSRPTSKDFGCVHFEQKSEGPFGIREERGYTVLTLYDKFNVRFDACADCHGTIVYLCDWLNEHWHK